MLTVVGLVGDEFDRSRIILLSKQTFAESGLSVRTKSHCQSNTVKNILKENGYDPDPQRQCGSERL